MKTKRHSTRKASSNDSSSMLKATITSLSLLAGSLTYSSNLHADPVPKQPKKWEKCFGIARALMNDCSSLDGKHGCSSKATFDSDPNEYVWVPKGTCKKIVNGTTQGINAFHAKKPKACKK